MKTIKRICWYRIGKKHADQLSTHTHCHLPGLCCVVSSWAIAMSSSSRGALRCHCLDLPSTVHQWSMSYTPSLLWCLLLQVQEAVVGYVWSWRLDHLQIHQVRGWGRCGAWVCHLLCCILVFPVLWFGQGRGKVRKERGKEKAKWRVGDRGAMGWVGRDCQEFTFSATCV